MKFDIVVGKKITPPLSHIQVKMHCTYRILILTNLAHKIKRLLRHLLITILEKFGYHFYGKYKNLKNLKNCKKFFFLFL